MRAYTYDLALSASTRERSLYKDYSIERIQEMQKMYDEETNQPTNIRHYLTGSYLARHNPEEYNKLTEQNEDNN